MEYGLIGAKLGHSFSPWIHEKLGDYQYELHALPPEELDRFMTERPFRGINITIPYKQAVIPYCAEISDRARRIGSVNTVVKRPDGTLYGDNTDYYGFRRIAEDSGVPIQGKKAVILGSGGTCKTARAVLEDLGASEIVVISRSGEDNYQNLERHADAKIVVNTTPVGMFPDNGSSPVNLDSFPLCECVLDVVYNPLETALCQQAEERGIPFRNGLLMLVAQARKAGELFLNTAIPEEKDVEIWKELYDSRRNIVLCGMPGSGKTTIGQELAKRMGRPLIDTDAVIVERTGRTIPDIFSNDGEQTFRDLESQAIADSAKQTGVILSLGGGAVLRKENRDAVRRSGLVVWLQRDIARLSIDGRPLSKQGSLESMFEKRKGFYQAAGHIIVENNSTPAEAAEKILAQL